MKEVASTGDIVTDCPFCNLPEKPDSLFDATSSIDVESGVFLKPDLGMLMPGHLLAVTKEHRTSFAQLDKPKLRNVNEKLSIYESALGERFGRYFRLEHGSDNLISNGSGACIEHAHIHLVPADEDVGEHIQEQLQWEQLSAYEDLIEFKGTPYIYLGRLAMHYAVPDPRLSGQWVRKEIARVRELDQWDWGIVDAKAELNETLTRIEDFPLEIFRGRIDE